MTESVLIELVEESNSLYFIFGGLGSNVGMPPFEFFSASKIIEENKIFIRDLSQSWYHTDLPGIGSSIDSLVCFISNWIARIQPNEVYFVGNSMGGFAAILVSSILGKGHAITFAPQTFISPLRRLRYRDWRWLRPISRTLLASALRPHIWDVRAAVENRVRPTQIDIYVSITDRLDYIHANRLRGLAGVTIHEYETGGHKLVRHLRDQGELPRILKTQGSDSDNS